MAYCQKVPTFTWKFYTARVKYMTCLFLPQQLFKFRMEARNIETEIAICRRKFVITCSLFIVCFREVKVDTPKKKSLCHV